MITIRDFKTTDKANFCAMAEAFYNSNAVSHAIAAKNITTTFDLCAAKSPYARGLILEYDSHTAGFGLLSFTHTLEAGGLVVLLEDLYIDEKFRGKGLAKQFFDFLFNEYNGKAARYRLEVTKTNQHAIDIYKRYGFCELDYVNMIRLVQ